MVKGEGISPRDIHPMNTSYTIHETPSIGEDFVRITDQQLQEPVILPEQVDEREMEYSTESAVNTILEKENRFSALKKDIERLTEPYYLDFAQIVKDAQFEGKITSSIGLGMYRAKKEIGVLKDNWSYYSNTQYRMSVAFRQAPVGIDIRSFHMEWFKDNYLKASEYTGGEDEFKGRSGSYSMQIGLKDDELQDIKVSWKREKDPYGNYVDDDHELRKFCPFDFDTTRKYLYHHRGKNSWVQMQMGKKLGVEGYMYNPESEMFEKGVIHYKPHKSSRLDEDSFFVLFDISPKSYLGYLKDILELIPPLPGYERNVPEDIPSY
jgi:hypothetical protein